MFESNPSRPPGEALEAIARDLELGYPVSHVNALFLLDRVERLTVERDRAAASLQEIRRLTALRVVACRAVGEGEAAVQLERIGREIAALIADPPPASSSPGENEGERS